MKKFLKIALICFISLGLSVPVFAGSKGTEKSAVSGALLGAAVTGIAFIAKGAGTKIGLSATGLMAPLVGMAGFSLAVKGIHWAMGTDETQIYRKFAHFEMSEDAVRFQKQHSGSSLCYKADQDHFGSNTELAIGSFLVYPDGKSCT